ncbi:MAG: leucyl/phenylalanyl-tRNA--protein transferase, partial [Spirochaetota bacterium]
AYTRLHELGYAHSVEAWRDGELAGGLYGVCLGGVFYGESMFHRTTNASKAAFVALVRGLEAHGVRLIDCQMETPLLSSFGARYIPREEFAGHLIALLAEETRRGSWKSWSPAS